MSAAIVDEIRDGIWSVDVPKPGDDNPYTLCYLIQDDRSAIHLIDPGWNSDEGWARLASAVQAIGCDEGDIVSVTVTHLHVDHLGMAARVRAASGASVRLGRIEQAAVDALTRGPVTDPALRLAAWGVPVAERAELEAAGGGRRHATSIRADALLDDGDRLEIPGREIVALHTPGHTSGHLCFVAADEALLFSGDHVLPGIFSGLGLGGPSASNPVSDYLTSLARVAQLGAEVAPGHEHRFSGLEARCEQLAEHHERRTREVAASLEARPQASVWEIAQSLTWTAGWPRLVGLNRYSALAQTAMHLDRVRSALAAS